jgi:arylsulfatase A-like enzyme
LFTGVYPHTSKDFGWTPHFKNPVLKNCKTFIEFFRENGYRVMGTGKLLHQNVKSIWDEWGIDERINYGPFAFNGTKSVGHPSVKEPFRSINNVDGSFAPLSDIPSFPADEVGPDPAGWTYGTVPFRYINDTDRDLMPDEMHARWVAGKIKELGNRTENQPFFLGVGFVKPHTPLYAPKRYFDMFPLDKIELPVMLAGDAGDCYYSSVYPPGEMGLHYYHALKESYPDDDLGLKLVLQAYLACVAFVDDQIGLVMEALNNSQFKDNTIVIFTSDNGWQMGEKDYLYKNSPWEESTRIPLIIRVPGKSLAGSEVDHPVSLIDIFPTLTDLCNLQGNPGRNDLSVPPEGYSLQPFLKDPGFKRWKGPEGALSVMGAGINKPVEGLGISTNKEALWHIEILKELDDSFIMQQNYSFRTKEWRYILYRNGREELYDHRNDPYEWVNLATDKNFIEKKKILHKEMLKIIAR